MALDLTQKLNLSPAMAGHLAKMGLNTLTDLILFRPLRYEDETHLTQLAAAKIGDTILSEGTILKAETQYRPRRQLILQVKDREEKIFFIRLLHFYPNQLKQYSAGTKIRALGELRTGLYGPEMVHPKLSTRFSPQLRTTLTPIYSTVRGLSQNSIRAVMEKALSIADLEETLPKELLHRYGLISFAAAIRELHAPDPKNKERLAAALTRLKFDELLAQQLSLQLIRQKRTKVKTSRAESASDDLARKLEASLPFALTSAQRRVLTEIGRDLNRPYPMHRLLQGDVGSGKTIVAALAALKIIAGGYQVALIAPTEILARQHFLKFKEWFAPLRLKVGWLAGGLRQKEKDAAKNQLKAGDFPLVVGTHALIQEDVVFPKLGLIIIDEQHRFGVKQRLALKEKGENTHQLMMSATPIPRTLSMTYFADVDLSVIDELPPGRQNVKTILCENRRREEVQSFVHHKISEGRQAYWVCPLIEESEVLQLQTALHCYEELRGKFPEVTIGLIHGRLKTAEKEAVMAEFKAGRTQLLVATTVIEVGVDIANASTMVIEHAERMGLSQLHQLRGRVGRGPNIAAECILLYQAPLSNLEKERLKIMYTSEDGFAIAREDLRLRGPGEFLGAKQSGIPLFRFADLNADMKWIEISQKEASTLLAARPLVASAHLARWLPARDAYLGV